MGFCFTKMCGFNRQFKAAELNFQFASVQPGLVNASFSLFKGQEYDSELSSEVCGG